LIAEDLHIGEILYKLRKSLGTPPRINMMSSQHAAVSQEPSAVHQLVSGDVYYKFTAGVYVMLRASPPSAARGLIILPSNPRREQIVAQHSAMLYQSLCAHDRLGSFISPAQVV